MKKTIRHLTWTGPLAAALLLLAGCQPAQMAMPDGLAASERLPVQGRQGQKIREHLRFGPYEARAVERSWTRGRDARVLLYEKNGRRQQYAFVLAEGTADRWQVSCDASLRRRTVHTPLVDVDVRDASRLDCRLRPLGGAGQAWHLRLEETRERPLEGVLSDGRRTLDVRGTRALRGGLPAEDTSGYHVLEAGRPVAAVEVLNGGAVWLGDGAAAERRALLSATAGALLLLEDLRAHLPDALAGR